MLDSYEFEGNCLLRTEDCQLHLCNLVANQLQPSKYLKLASFISQRYLQMLHHAEIHAQWNSY